MKTAFALVAVLCISAAAAQEFSPKQTEMCLLTPAEMRSFGVIIQAGQAFYTEPPASRTSRPRKVVFTRNSIHLRSGRAAKDAPAKISPVFAVVEFPGGTAAYFRDPQHFTAAVKSKAEHYPEAIRHYSDPDNLIAVRFDLPAGSSPATSVTLWYLPTKDFLEQLPERYSNAVKNSVNDPDAPNYVQHDSDNRLHFEFKGLAPNPAASGETRATITVRGTVMLTVALFDLSGQKIAELPAREFSRGEHTIAIPVNELPAGMFIVGIRSADGQTEFERLMITR